MMIQSNSLHGYQPAPPPHPQSSSSRKKSARIRPPSRQQTSYDLFDTEDPEKVVNPEREIHSRASSITVSRPSSSLSKYKPLPPIGSPQNADFENTNNNTQFADDVTDSLRKLQINISVPSVDDHGGAAMSEHKVNRRHDSKRIHSGKKRDSYIPNSPGTRSAFVSSLDKSVMSSNDSAIDTTYPQESLLEEPLVEASLDLHPPRTPDKGILLAIKLPNGERLQGQFSPTTRLKSVLNFAEMKSGCDFNGFSLIQNSPKKIFSHLSKTLAECGITDKMLLFVDTED